MKAISVMQPWASLIVGWVGRDGACYDGRKSVENRTWSPPTSLIGQRIAIHASMKVDSGGETVWLSHGDTLIEPAHLPRASVVGVATLAMVVLDECELEQWREKLAAPSGDDDAYWYTGDVGLVLRERRGLREPVSCRGALGFWRLPADVEAKVRKQL